MQIVFLTCTVIYYSIFVDEIMSAFRRFGPLVVDWPHKAESKSYFPPKGTYRKGGLSIVINELLRLGFCSLACFPEITSRCKNILHKFIVNKFTEVV